ncbi:hypothetical protein O9993_22685 [Vibrio lentus]|nr:hypothetical protein [Vibrio lentus]
MLKGRIKVKAMVTRRVKKPGLAFLPFHFGGKFEGEDLRSQVPRRRDPYVDSPSSQCNGHIWL